MNRDAKRLTDAIKRYCIYCSGGSRSAAQKCRINDCPLMGVTDMQQPRKTRQQLRAEGQQLRITIEVKA